MGCDSKSANGYFQRIPYVASIGRVEGQDVFQIFAWVNGFFYKEIADAPGVRIDTVAFLLGNIYKKLHVRNSGPGHRSANRGPSLEKRKGCGTGDA